MRLSIHMPAYNAEATIASGRSQFAVRVLPAEEFLRLPQVTGDAVNLDAPSLVGALHQVHPFFVSLLIKAGAGHERDGMIVIGICLQYFAELPYSIF